MSELLTFTTLVNLALTICGLWAAITASSTLKRCRKLIESSSMRSLTQLDAETAALASSLSSLSTTVKRLSSRNGMRELRASRATTKPALSSDPKIRKAQLREGLANGTLRVISDAGPAIRSTVSDHHPAGNGVAFADDFADDDDR